MIRRAFLLLAVIAVPAGARINAPSPSDRDALCVGTKNTETCTDKNGNFIPTVTNNQTLGTSGLQWDKGYFNNFQSQNATINGNVTGSLFINGPVPWCDIKANGAKGDGITDDSTVITNTFASCPDGGIVFFSSGVYIVSSGFNMPDKRITLLGQGFNSQIGNGEGTLIKCTGVSSGSPCVLGSSSTNSKGSQIRSIGIRTVSGSTAVVVNMNMVLDDVTLDALAGVGSGGVGLKILNCPGCFISNFKIYGSLYGIYLAPKSGGVVNANRFTNGVVNAIGTGAYGIYVSSDGRNNVIQSNVFDTIDDEQNTVGDIYDGGVNTVWINMYTSGNVTTAASTGSIVIGGFFSSGNITSAASTVWISSMVGIGRYPSTFAAEVNGTIEAFSQVSINSNLPCNGTNCRIANVNGTESLAWDAVGAGGGVYLQTGGVRHFYVANNGSVTILSSTTVVGTLQADISPSTGAPALVGTNFTGIPDAALIAGGTIPGPVTIAGNLNIIGVLTGNISSATGTPTLNGLTVNGVLTNNGNLTVQGGITANISNSTGTPTLTGTNFSGIPASAILAGGTFPGNQTINGNLTVVGTYTGDLSPSTGTPKGTTSGNNAAAGNIGEFMSNALGATQNLAPNNAYVAIATITLTAGDWDVSGVAALDTGATTAATGAEGCIDSNASCAGAQNGNANRVHFGNIVANEVLWMSVGPTRFNVTTNTTVFLLGTVTYTVNGGATWDTQSFLRARRVR